MFSNKKQKSTDMPLRVGRGTGVAQIDIYAAVP